MPRLGSITSDILLSTRPAGAITYAGGVNVTINQSFLSSLGVNVYSKVTAVIKLTGVIA